MCRIFLSMSAICLCYSMSTACLGPINVEGVAFTSGETMDLQNLTKLGVENENYLKDTQETNKGIRFKSHYDPRATVFIGNYGMAFKQNVRINCMGVVLPLPDSSNAYSAIAKTTFDFAAAVKTELTWLALKGIVDLSSATIAKIDSSLNASPNGGLQYWTHADSVLWYNMWYENDSVSGTWTINGVKGIRSLNKVQGCSVVIPGSGLPPQALGTTVVASNSVIISKRSQALAVRHLGSGGLIVFLPQSPRSEAVVVVTNCKGAVVCTKSVPANIQSVCIDGLAFGRYTARLLHD
jgi:hypothetical protein